MSDFLVLDVPEKGEVFTYHDGDNNVTLTFAVALMRQMLAKSVSRLVGKRRMPMDAVHVAHIRKNMGIEQERLDRLVDPWLHEPCIAILRDKTLPPAGLTIIDGQHRIVKLFEAGETGFDCYIFHPLLWRQFILNVPLPEDWRDIRSGIIENERDRDRDVCMQKMSPEIQDAARPDAAQTMVAPLQETCSPQKILSQHRRKS